MRYLSPLIITILLLSFTRQACATFDQTLSRNNFQSSICNIESMKVSFRIDRAFGEPLITSRMRWTAGPNTAGNCLSPLTYVWLHVRTADNTQRYIKVSPEITTSGDDFGHTATESPTWSSLFCSAPTDSADCETADAAKAMFDSRLAFEGFDVSTETKTLSGFSRQAMSVEPDRPANGKQAKLEALLEEAVDSALAPTLQKSEPPPETKKPELTPEQIAERERMAREDGARAAVNNVVTLIASSLAQFTTPAHPCESRRVVANWVQVRGTCQLNFRREINHSFLCSDDGEPQPIKASGSASINLAKDLARVEPVRVSGEGWAAVVLDLNDDLRTTSQGRYKTNRWQFTAASDKLEDLKKLATSIQTLKQFCESNPAS